MIEWKKEWKTLSLLVGAFAACVYLPIGNARFDRALLESLHLLKWYAQEHVILCLVPAFFIAGAIAVFVSRASVMKYLGAGANKVIAYSVASVSGTILAVCSCTVLPLFAGIYRMGAGLGPATAFLYSGPAINVLAIALTARILGMPLGIARAVGAVVFSVVIGLLMHLIFRDHVSPVPPPSSETPTEDVPRPLWQNAIYFLTMVAILVFANWGKPLSAVGLTHTIYAFKWAATSLFSIALAVILVIWFGMPWWKVILAGLPAVVLALMWPHAPMIPFAAGVIGLSTITSTSKDDCGEWFSSTWRYTKQIMPLLFAGVLAAGLLLGSPTSPDSGLIPSAWVSNLVGGNSLRANLFASTVGALMYFATLTEVPILQGLISNGMGQGPALALLLAGPAISLPNMLVIRTVLGTKRTLVFVLLVIVTATLSGVLFGWISPGGHGA